MARRRVLDVATFVTVNPLTARTQRATAGGSEVVVRSKDGREVVGRIDDEQAARIVDAAEHHEDVMLLTTTQELSTTEAATLLGMSSSRVKQLLDAGALPSRRVGRDRRIRSEDIARFKLERERRAKLAPQFVGDDEIDLASNDDFTGTP